MKGVGQRVPQARKRQSGRDVRIRVDVNVVVEPEKLEADRLAKDQPNGQDEAAAGGQNPPRWHSAGVAQRRSPRRSLRVRRRGASFSSGSGHRRTWSLDWAPVGGVLLVERLFHPATSRTIRKNRVRSNPNTDFPRSANGARRSAAERSAIRLRGEGDRAPRLNRPRRRRP